MLELFGMQQNTCSNSIGACKDAAHFPRRRLSALFAPVDIAPLVYFRVVFGAIMMWEVSRFFQHGWIHRYYVEPEFYFGYHRFEWLQPWPGVGMYLHFILLGMLAACVMLGLFYRFAAVLFFLGFTFVFLLDETNYLNHFYLISLVSLLMIFLPAHHAASLDALCWPQIKSNRMPAWCLWLLRFQLAVPYVYGGIAKINTDWLQGEPMRIWLAERANAAPLEGLFNEEWFVYAMSYGGLLFDLMIVPLLLWSRTRWFAVIWLAAFHLTNAYLFNIGIFPWLMLLTTPVFFPPSMLRKAANAIGVITETAEFLPAESSRPTVGRAVCVLAIAVYVAIQVVVPFRHVLYPGNPSWTEEGHRFSWHMKLHDKSGKAVFIVKDPEFGQTWIVHPEDYLTQRQVSKLPSHPDMILQFSHYLQQVWREKGHTNVEVYADVRVSLNGRPRVPLVNRKVDLTQQRRSLAPATWIRPLNEPLQGKTVAHFRD